MPRVVITGAAGFIGSHLSEALLDRGYSVVGIDKSSVKGRIRELNTQREAAIAAHDHAQLKAVRRSIHRLKRQIHKATV